MAKKTKLLFVISAFAYGAGKVLFETLRRLDAGRYDISVAVLWRRHEEFIPELGSHVKVYDLGAKEIGLALQIPSLVSRLRRAVRDSAPEVVIGLLWDANLISVMTGFLSPRVRVIICEHTSPIGGIKRIYGHSLMAKIALSATSFFYSNARAVVAISRGVENELLELGIPRDKIRMIYNPIDFSGIRSMMTEEIGIVPPYVLYVGQLVSSKNITLLLNAFARAASGMNLVLVGDGPYRAELAGQAGRLGLSDRVVFAGYDKNPYKYMSRASLLVLPSKTESFGLVLLEAMACGCPVITTDCMPDPTEVVETGINGFVVPRGDVEAMTAAISRLLADRELCDRFIKNGYERLGHFDPEIQVRAYEALFSEVIGEAEV